MITSTVFYLCCAAGASAPVVVKNQSPRFGTMEARFLQKCHAIREAAWSEPSLKLSTYLAPPHALGNHSIALVPLSDSSVRLNWTRSLLLDCVRGSDQGCTILVCFGYGLGLAWFEQFRFARTKVSVSHTSGPGT